MPQVVALKFAEGDFPTYYLPGPVADVKAQDFCVAPRNQSEQVGFVAAVEMWSARQTSPDHPLPSLSRRATPEEIERWWQQKAFERRAMVICKEKVLQHGLPIKISVAQFDEKAGKITFYFTSDKRVDFRALVRDLATILRCRIELWQIGAREEAQLLDGHGICGLRTCCSSWLKNFNPVTLRMAKDQDIDLPPAKLTGQCGRLLCCLAYELEAYQQLAAEALPRGTGVRHARGKGVVVDRNLISRVYVLSDEDGKYISVPFDEIQEFHLPEQMKKMGARMRGQARENGNGGEAGPGPEPPTPPSRPGAGASRREETRRGASRSARRSEEPSGAPHRETQESSASLPKESEEPLAALEDEEAVEMEDFEETGMEAPDAGSREENGDAGEASPRSARRRRSSSRRRRRRPGAGPSGEGHSGGSGGEAGG